MKTFSLFDGSEKFINLRPIRLIELFGGVQAQATALHELGVEFEHYRYVDFDKYAVKSANAMYGTNFEPLDITKISANDLGVVETENYCYIMTYSFPCTDLSLAGKGAGMQKGSGTRSGLLWEVERLLNEMYELPQVLLMENVPQVHGKKNIDSFNEWQQFLKSKGYKNFWKDLNAKNYGIPQNRNRCFMISILNYNGWFEFPQPQELKLRLKDMLERMVDEKYYIKNAKVNTLLKGLDYENADKVCCDMTINEPRFRDVANTIKAKYDCGIENQKQTGTAVIEPKCEVVAMLDIPGRFESACRVHGIDGIAPACNTCGGGGLETKIAEPMILQQPHGFNKGAELELCPSITTSCWESNNLLKEPIIVVDLNIKNCVRKNYEREKENIAHSDKDIYQCHCESGFQDNKVGIKVSPTLRAGNSHTAVYNNYRIRKLAPKECWRLMGFRDELSEKAEQVNSNAQLYKQAGNSIVVTVLMAIFGELLSIEWQSKVKKLVESLKEFKVS